MRQIRKSTAAAIVGLGALALLATPSFAAGGHSTGAAGAPPQLTHMSQGQGGQWSGQPGSMGMMAPQGMMGPGSGGNWNCPIAADVAGDRELSVDDVRARLERNLEWHGNARLKVGDVVETEDGTIIADIVTVDDSLVQRMVIDRHTGQMRSVE